MKRYRIKITSGDAKGRYIGMRFGGGLVTNPEVQKNPPVNMTGTTYGLWAQRSGATEFFEGPVLSVQAELKRLGFDSALEDVNILDELTGLSLSRPNVEQLVLGKCKAKLAEEPNLGCIHLLFGGDNVVIVNKDETVESLKRKLDEIRGQGNSHIESVGS
jgi:hypothetical protein